MDRDRSEGLIYVNYSEDGDAERGFFSRIFTREKDPTDLEIQYLIDVSQVDDSIKVRVFNKDNAQIEQTSALRILSALRTNLS